MEILGDLYLSGGSLSVETKTITKQLKVTTNPGAGKILISGNHGDASWSVQSDVFWTSGATGDGSVKTKEGYNSSTDNYAISFGSGSTASGKYSLAGGYKNVSSGDTSFVIAEESRLSAHTSSILGGKTHRITGSSSSSVVGGTTNRIDNQWAGCPDGYTLTVGGDLCVSAKTATVTDNTSTNHHTVNAGNTNSAYSTNGTVFYTTNLDGDKPYKLTGNSSALKNNSGGAIAADSSVSGVALWDSNGSTSNGRLNIGSVWNSSIPDDEWVGFSQCVNIIEPGTYSIGLAADNRTKFYINGIEFFTSVDLDDNSDKNLTYWRVFETELSSGNNIIEMLALNDSSAYGFAAEIYSASCKTLSALTTTSALEPYIVFSTKDIKGGSHKFDLGENSGYECPAGYALDCTKEFCIAKATATPTIQITAETKNSIIVGGNQNGIKDSDSAAVVGGYQNYVELQADYSAVVGGNKNRVRGQNSVIIGGEEIVGTADNTVYVQNLNISGVTTYKEYEVASLPTAATYKGAIIMVSDETGGYVPAFSDGTNWRRMTDRAIVS